jgi:tetratricopeptide (TPR) repeat protein
MRAPRLPVLAAAILLVALARLGAFEPTRSYLFDYWGDTVPAPQPYELERTIDGTGLGVGAFSAPFDICFASDGSFWLSDTGNARVVHVAADLASATVLDAFVLDGSDDAFYAPGGLATGPGGSLYVADGDAARVLRFDAAAAVTGTWLAPPPDIEGVITENFVFKPVRVAASPLGRVYVASEGVYEGLMEYDAAGAFSGFIGAPRVRPNALDVFWRWFSTRAQRARTALFLPTEYTSMDLDARGFIWATEKTTLKRLNPSGEDVFVPKGFALPKGDLPVANDAVEKPSLFTDLAVRQAGMVSVLDLQRGRIFTYDGVGNLLYVFGGIGLTRTLFQSPSAIAERDGRLYVVDRTLGRILVFRPLPYALAIHAAVEAYESGHYEEATARWREVLAMNVNDDLAYTGIGRALLQEGRFAEAMASFRLGNDRTGYSEAFRLERRRRMTDRFGRFVLALGLAAAAFWAWRRFSPVRRLLVAVGLIAPQPGAVPTGGRRRLALAAGIEGFLFAGHVSRHPYDGFYDLKFERRGGTGSALALLAVFCIAALYAQQGMAFLFNTRDPRRINVLVEVIGVLAPFLMWCVVNWALSILLEGKGTFREIVMATAYAFTPITVCLVAATALSGLAALEEGTFVWLIVGIGAAWSVYLLFAGTLTVHEYTTARTLASILLTILGIGVVIFVGLLFFSVVNLLVGFVSSVYGELVLRF